MNADLFQALLDEYVEGLYEDGTIERWKREDAERKARRQRKPCRYDKAAVMRSAWRHRKAEGLSMSAAMRRAWADAKRSGLRLVA